MSSLSVSGSSGKTLRFKNFLPDMDASPETLDFSRPVSSYNFDTYDGGIRTIGGTSELFGEKKIAGCGDGKLCFYRKYDFELGKRADKLVICPESGEMQYIDLSDEGKEMKTLEYPALGGDAQCINYRLDGEDCLILSSKAHSLLIWDGKTHVEEVADAPKITSACLHSERLFATESGEGSRLWFSDDMDPRNWSVSLDEAGYIELTGDKGRLLKVVSFSDYVYIFRSYGISRLSAYGGQEEFAIGELFTSSGRIIADTVTVCGDCILFAATDGLYRFDGVNAVKLDLGLNEIFRRADFARADACFYSGKYYLAMKDGAPDTADFVNDVLFIYDTENRRYSIVRGIDVASLCPVTAEDGDCLAILVREGGDLKLVGLSETPSQSEVVFYPSTMGLPGRLKLIKNIYVTFDGEVEVQTWADGKIRAYQLTHKNSFPLAIFAAAKRFGFTIRTKKKANVSFLSLEYEVL